MARSTSRSARIHNAFEVAKSDDPISDARTHGRTTISGSGHKVCAEKPFKSFKRKLIRVFSEDYESMKVEKNFFDPRGPFIHRWNKIFLLVCIASLFVDPLFFFVLGVQDVGCIYTAISFQVNLTVLRSILDAFYAIQIFIRFRTAFTAPSSRVLGRGELVLDTSKIALRYLSKGFWLDFIAALPIPQFLVWVVIPKLSASLTNTKILLLSVIFFQYLPRLFLIFPLSAQIISTTGVMTENAWAGAAYNMILYILTSHVIGAAWFLQAIQRQDSCWRVACRQQSPPCQYRYFDCKSIDDARNTWYQSSNLTTLCAPSNYLIFYGIYAEAVYNDVTPSPFLQKYFYSFFWGIKNLSCLGQNLITSPNIVENIFAIIVAVLGLVLFGLLIGNVQSYLQSSTVRFEEWRVKRTDTENWMHHRQLPPDLKKRVRRYDVYKWVANQGVDEENLLKTLPMDLCKDIKRHLCLDLVRQVPIFDEMDDRMLDAICERLRPTLFTTGTRLVRELDPVKEMVFIIRGRLDSYTTGGGRAGFFNSCCLGPGEFCGEELLMWAMDPCPAAALPSSTRTVRAVSEIEGFALVAKDLRFVATQFHRLHSKKLRHKFRFYSQPWRTWAACYIQAAWRRRRQRRRQSLEHGLDGGAAAEAVNTAEAGAATFVARLMVRSSMRRMGGGDSLGPDGRSSSMCLLLRKPREPDFSMVEKS